MWLCTSCLAQFGLAKVIDTCPATIAVTKPSSMDRLVAAAPVRPCSHTSSLSSGIATAVIGGCAERRRRALMRRLASGLTGRLPVPRQKFVELMVLGAAGHDALEHVAEISLRIDPIEFCRVQYRS